MDLLRDIVLGMVQGITEFVPVSSSAHLVIVPWLFGWEKPTLIFDTILHWGTLLAVLVYFRRDLLVLLSAWGRSLRQRDLRPPEARLAWLLVVSTIPAVILGLLAHDFFESLFDSPNKVAILLLVTGVFLALSESAARRKRNLDRLGLVDALLIGLAQGVSIAPGISRSGATIGTGLLVGIKREAAARYSFLLAIPVILGAGLVQTRGLFHAGDSGAQAISLAVGFATAAVVGYLCIRFFLSYLKRGRLYVFSAYCLLAGTATLVVSAVR